jgi:hypothetical protein
LKDSDNINGKMGEFIEESTNKERDRDMDK